MRWKKGSTNQRSKKKKKKKNTKQNILCKRITLALRKHTQIDSNRLKKDTPYKRKPKIAESGILISDKIYFKTKIVLIIQDKVIRLW